MQLGDRITVPVGERAGARATVIEIRRTPRGRKITALFDDGDTVSWRE